jgi:hypothetical protein
MSAGTTDSAREILQEFHHSLLAELDRLGVQHATAYYDGSNSKRPGNLTWIGHPPGTAVFVSANNGASRNGTFPPWGLSENRLGGLEADRGNKHHAWGVVLLDHSPEHGWWLPDSDVRALIKTCGRRKDGNYLVREKDLSGTRYLQFDAVEAVVAEILRL